MPHALICRKLFSLPLGRWQKVTAAAAAAAAGGGGVLLVGRRWKAVGIARDPG